MVWAHQEVWSWIDGLEETCKWWIRWFFLSRGFQFKRRKESQTTILKNINKKKSGNIYGGIGCTSLWLNHNTAEDRGAGVKKTLWWVESEKSKSWAWGGGGNDFCFSPLAHTYTHTHTHKTKQTDADKIFMSWYSILICTLFPSHTCKYIKKNIRFNCLRIFPF
jgi:hypothetical protein